MSKGLCVPAKGARCQQKYNFLEELTIATATWVSRNSIFPRKTKIHHH